MDRVPISDRTKLLSDNGPGYVSRAFRDYLGMVGIKHILASPFHPQTNGKLERYHQTLKRDVNQLPYQVPSDLEAVLHAEPPEHPERRVARKHELIGDLRPDERERDAEHVVRKLSAGGRFGHPRNQRRGVDQGVCKGDRLQLGIGLARKANP